MTDPSPPRVAARPVPPRSVDVAGVATVVAAIVNAASGLLVLTQIGSTRALLELNAQREGTDPGALEPIMVASLTAICVISLLFSAATVILFVLFRRGRAWARPAFFAVSMLSLFAVFSLTGLSLAVIVLLATADVLLYRSVVSAWVRGLRGMPAS